MFIIYSFILILFNHFYLKIYLNIIYFNRSGQYRLLKWLGFEYQTYTKKTQIFTIQGYHANTMVSKKLTLGCLFTQPWCYPTYNYRHWWCFRFWCLWSMKIYGGMYRESSSKQICGDVLCAATLYWYNI